MLCRKTTYSPAVSDPFAWDDDKKCGTGGFCAPHSPHPHPHLDQSRAWCWTSSCLVGWTSGLAHWGACLAHPLSIGAKCQMASNSQLLTQNVQHSSNLLLFATQPRRERWTNLEVIYSMMWLIKPKKYNNNQYYAYDHLGERSKRQYYWMRNKEQYYVHSPGTTGSGLGWLQMSTELSRSILVESY
jgi:hypothetical protein